MSAAIHEETQQTMWWVHVIVVVCIAASLATMIAAPAATGGWWLIIPIVILLSLYGFFMPMTVHVSSEAMEVRFGYFGWPRWIFPVNEISQARVVTFRPLRHYGGWGIRGGEEGYCLNERGNQGVRFEHIGKTYTVGSDDPECLLSALRTAGADVSGSSS
ncbi:MAG: hypothetical protein R6V07_08110 [Armatimonadota bacterium]